MGQIKKVKAIFDNPLMSKRDLGQGRGDALTDAFLRRGEGSEQAGKTRLFGQGNPLFNP